MEMHNCKYIDCVDEGSVDSYMIWKIHDYSQSVSEGCTVLFAIMESVFVRKNEI